MPGLIAPVLRTDLGLQHWHIGLLVSLHFASSALSEVPAGRITDRWGTRLAIVANLTLTAAGAALAAILGSYPGLVAAAVLSGLGNALSWFPVAAFLMFATSLTRVGASEPGRSGRAMVGVRRLPGFRQSYEWAWFILCMLVAGAFVSLRFAGWIAPPRHTKAQVTPSGS